MSQTASVWAVLLSGAIAANLPFLTARLLGLWALRRPKSLVLRLLEMAIFYGAVIGLGLMLEQRAGQIAPQGWEFYAVTVALFATLAFPGFVYRYLLRRRG